MSSGSLLSLCLGEPEDGVVRVFFGVIVGYSPATINFFFFLSETSI